MKVFWAKKYSTSPISFKRCVSTYALTYVYNLEPLIDNNFPSQFRFMFYWLMSKGIMACHLRALRFFIFLFNGTKGGINLKVHFFSLVTDGAINGSVKISLKDEEKLEKETVKPDSRGICWSHLNPWNRLYLWQVNFMIRSNWARHRQGVDLSRSVVVVLGCSCIRCPCLGPHLEYLDPVAGEPGDKMPIHPSPVSHRPSSPKRVTQH